MWCTLYFCSEGGSPHVLGLIVQENGVLEDKPACGPLSHLATLLDEKAGLFALPGALDRSHSLVKKNKRKRNVVHKGHNPGTDRKGGGVRGHLIIVGSQEVAEGSEILQRLQGGGTQ